MAMVVMLPMPLLLSTIIAKDQGKHENEGENGHDGLHDVSPPLL
jgi:hypothetical protein